MHILNRLFDLLSLRKYHTRVFYIRSNSSLAHTHPHRSPLHRRVAKVHHNPHSVYPAEYSNVHDRQPSVSSTEAAAVFAKSYAVYFVAAAQAQRYSVTRTAVEKKAVRYPDVAFERCTIGSWYSLSRPVRTDILSRPLVKEKNCPSDTYRKRHPHPADHLDVVSSFDCSGTHYCCIPHHMLGMTRSVSGGRKLRRVSTGCRRRAGGSMLRWRRWSRRRGRRMLARSVCV